MFITNEAGDTYINVDHIEQMYVKGNGPAQGGYNVVAVVNDHEIILTDCELDSYDDARNLLYYFVNCTKG